MSVPNVGSRFKPRETPLVLDRNGLGLRFIQMSLACATVIPMLFMALPASAAAVRCGQAEGKGQPVIGELSVLKETSVTDLKFGTSGDSDKFIMHLKVSGCTLASADQVEANVDVSEPARKAVGDPKKVLEGSGQLKIEIPVSPTFPTKQYKPVLTLSSPSDIVSTTQVALTMQRKEKALAPFLIALFAFVIGTWWAFYLAKTTVEDKLKEDERITLKKRHRVTAAGGALIGAVPVFISTYVTPETWSLGLGTGFALLLGVASAAAGGATAGASTAYVASKRKQRKEAKAARLAAAPGGRR